MSIFHLFQQLRGRRWLWMLESYWRLWPILLRIKVKQDKWLRAQFTLKQASSVHRSSKHGLKHTIELGMYESVRLAARLHFFEVQCLPRSIALAHMLCARGYDAQLVVGVAASGHGFASHAWVEVSGTIIGEPEDLADNFISLNMPSNET